MILSIVYIAAICAANFSVHLFGPIITPINAFIFIGLDFVIRDKLHDRVGICKMFILIMIAGVISFIINPATNMIAIASVSAFALAAVTDAGVYQLLIRKNWLVKSNISNVASSVVDSIVFPIIAFGVFLPWVIVGQIIAKILGGAVWSWILRGIK